jgi:hypothetical protein
MLQTSAGSAKGHQIRWSNDEFDAIARELVKRYPMRNFFANGLKVTNAQEVEDAADAVIRQERQHSISEMFQVEVFLKDAFERIAHNPSSHRQGISFMSTPLKSPIKWSPEEWELVALEMHRMLPNAFADNLQFINMKQIHQSVEVLPPHRRRAFAAKEQYTKGILAAWQMIPEGQRNPAKAETQVVDFASGPIVEPAPRSSDSQSAMASAMHEAFQRPQEKKKQKTKVFWTSTEFMQLAREMYRQNPFGNFLKTHVIDLDAVRGAQRALLENGTFPPHRRRDINSVINVRDSLLDAFKRLSLELEEEAQKMQAEVSEAMDEAEASLPNTPEIDPTPEVEPQPQVREPQQVAPAQGQLFVAKLASATAPLVNFLVKELVAAMLPDLVSAMSPAIAQAIQDGIANHVRQIAPPVQAKEDPKPPVAQISDEPEINTQPKPDAVQPILQPVKKPKIVVMGPIPRQQNDLIETFPEYRFAFIEHNHGIKENGPTCELFIVNTSSMSRMNKTAVKKYVPEPVLKYAHGGNTGIKRVIWAHKASKQ